MTKYEKKLKEKYSVLFTTNCHTIIYDHNHMIIYNSDLIKIIDIIGTIYKPYLDNLSENDKLNLKICYPYFPITIYQKIHISIKSKQECLFDEQWESTVLSTVDPNYNKKLNKENKCNYNYIIDGKYIRKIQK